MQRRLSGPCGRRSMACLFRQEGAAKERVGMPTRSSISIPVIWVARRGFSTGAPLQPTPRVYSTPTSSVSSPSLPPAQTTAASAVPPFTNDEICALVRPLIPIITEEQLQGSADLVSLSATSATQLLRHLPQSLRTYLPLYEGSAVRGTDATACEIWVKKEPPIPSKGESEIRCPPHTGVVAYLRDHLTDEIVLIMPQGRIARRTRTVTYTNTAASPMSLPSGELDQEGTKHGGGSSASTAATPPGEGDAATATLVTRRGIALPPPPQPLGRSERYNGSANRAGFSAPSNTGGAGGATFGAVRGATAATTTFTVDTDAPVPLRTSIQIMEALVEYIPTFFVPVESIAPTIPSAIQELYRDTNFRFFLRRFKHYVDINTNYGQTDVRLKPSFDHPRRGAADGRHKMASPSSADGAQNGNPQNRPPRNSEANLIGLIAPRVPKEFTPLADVLQEVSPIVSRHPAFDARLGVSGLFNKYPEYFQIVNGKLRARPYKVAPNALDTLDHETSPMPVVFAKILDAVTQAAEGKTYSEPEEKAAAAVSTGRLYSLLNPAQKAEVKVKCRSFPTFLRLHGKDLVVSVDKMRVHRFVPEYEPCVETLLDERLRMNAIDPNDPVLKIPAEMSPEVNADWAVQELYDALPLVQCAELEEVLSLVPTAVREALPKTSSEVQAVLAQYGEYFSLWPYPDDPAVIVVQRAKVEQPVLDKTAIARMVVPLIPQGGTTLSSLRTRAPLALQRYFYQHGTVKTLSEMTEFFALSGDRIVRIA